MRFTAEVTSEAQRESTIAHTMVANSQEGNPQCDVHCFQSSCTC